MRFLSVEGRKSTRIPPAALFCLVLLAKAGGPNHSGKTQQVGCTQVDRYRANFDPCMAEFWKAACLFKAKSKKMF